VEVALSNPALEDLGFFVGEWSTTISNASFLEDRDEVVTGTLQAVPIEAGMLLALRQVGDPAGPPLASWVIGRDGPERDYTVLYTDGRGVSRVYLMSLSDDAWIIWRDDPEFAQRFEATISADRCSLDGSWQKRIGGGSWEHDFDIAYSRR
jgi:hypothetical protein